MLQIITLIFLTIGEFVGHGDATDHFITRCLKHEREALLDFKDGLEDPDQNPRLLTWKGSYAENPDDSDHDDDDEGLDSSERYAFWILSEEIRPSLTKLKSLKHLDLSCNTFNDISIPIFYGSKLQNLQYLNLSNAGFSGPIPPNLGNLSSLRYLDLSSNTFDSKVPNWLANVSSLVTIDLSNNLLHGRIPLSLADLPNLEILSLNSNGILIRASTSQLLRGRWEKIQGVIPSSIGKLYNLKFFLVGSNSLTGNLPESLEVSRNYVSSRPLTSLQHLDISSNELSGRLPEWLGQLENLIELTLYNNLLYGPILNSLHLLQNLEQLDLGWNRLNGTLPKSIGQLSELSVLRVDSNNLTGVVTEKHFLKHTKLKILDISFNSFKLDVASNWVPPFQTRFIGMSSCYLNSSFPGWLQSQKKIKLLAFSNSSIFGSVPSWFWEISPGLESFNFSFNQLNGQLPSSFKVKGTFAGSIPENISAALPKLKILSLVENQIKGKIPASIGNMQSILVIDLSGNNLTGTIPPSIGNCSQLRALDLSENNLSGN
ncbi:LRR domain containing protein [Parasponia andersonii]|uniref:LRR domain containing protein n=1 Tax=Parasponia andersonii TaxID=3476 RepID=A0A2P5DLY3_PARAD|nr:LRR domain containing protein [Parasponia andersonii]